MSEESFSHLWENVVKTALLGTERQSLPRPQGGSQLGQTLAQIKRLSPEEQLLDLAATLSLYQAVGQHAPSTPLTPLPVAPKDTLPVCSEAAGQMLSHLLFSHHREVLPEFLDYLATVGQRVPEQYLPSLLNFGRRVTKHRPLITAVIGERGRWLATQNPQWRYASFNLADKKAITQLWHSDQQKNRQALFQLLRHFEPDLARQLLEQTWAHEKQPDQSYFIRLFETNLTMADEPFLEEFGLDASTQQIRRKAAELLAHLPESRLCQRMAERTRPHLKWFWLSRQIGSTLPDKTTAAMKRDGITQRSTRSGMGQQSWRLTQMLAATPLETWETAFDTSIDNMIQGLKKNKWRRTVLRGWTQAAERQKNSAWALAILRHSDLTTTSNRAMAKLVTVLPPAEREAFMLEIAERYSADLELHRYHPLILILERCRHPWSEALANQFITRLLAFIRSENTPRLDQIFIKTLQNFARYIPPHLADAFKQQLLTHTEQSPTWRPIITEMASTLKFRQEMSAEILRTEE